MSGSNRRRCHAQLWSVDAIARQKKGTVADPQKNTCQYGQRLEGKPFVFTDPRKVKMASAKPYNFSWVVPGVLAGSGLPERPAHVQYILDEKIEILVSLTEWKPSLHLAPGLHHIHMAIKEFEPPSLKQAIDFVTLVEEASMKKQAVAVHCHWGRGRTGTLIACYLVKANRWSPEKAITTTRQTRPHSIETYEQERLVFDYHKHLQEL